MHFVCPLYSNTLAWAWLATDNSKWFPETPGNHPPLSMPNLTCMIHYWAFVWTSEHHSLKLIFLDFAQASDFIFNGYLLLKSYWDYRVTPEMWVERLFLVSCSQQVLLLWMVTSSLGMPQGSVLRTQLFFINNLHSWSSLR